jgi:hypothetical protein
MIEQKVKQLLSENTPLDVSFNELLSDYQYYYYFEIFKSPSELKSVHHDLKNETRYKIETNILFNFYIPHLEQADDMKSFLRVSMNFCLVNYPEDKLPLTTFKVSILNLKSEQFVLKNALIQRYSDVVPKDNPFFLNISNLDKMHLNDTNFQDFVMTMNDKHIKPYIASLFVDGKFKIEEYKTLINPRQASMFTKGYNTLLSNLVLGMSDEKIDFRDVTSELKNEFFQLTKSRRTLALFNSLNDSLDDKPNTSKKKI